MKELLLKHWKLIGVLCFITYLAISNNVNQAKIGQLKDEKYQADLDLKSDSIADLEKKNYLLLAKESSIIAFIDSSNAKYNRDSIGTDSINKHYENIITNIDSFSLDELIEKYPISE